MSTDPKSLPASVTPGDAVGLRLEEDGAVTALLALPSRLPFGLGRPREFAAGKLGQKASQLLKPALETHAHLRVRVVEIEPAHLSHNGRSRLYISVWGDPKLVAPERPRHSIFSSSRIHDLPADRKDD